MPRRDEEPTLSRPDPKIGHHVATLNLFREEDGTFWLTCADARGAVEEAKRLNNGSTPMQVLAMWVREAGARFIESWGRTMTSDQQKRVEAGQPPVPPTPK